VLTDLPFGHVPTKVCLPVGAKVSLLLEEGADTLVRNHLGLTALDFATQGPHAESVVYVDAFMRAALAKLSK
jgi:ankyrin repeat protein